MHLSRTRPYVSFVSDEVAQVAVLHVGQDHQRRALLWQADSEKRENVGVAEVLHDDPFLQELWHLLQVRDALKTFKIIFKELWKTRHLSTT